MAKRILLLVALVALTAQHAWADVYVHGHYRSNGSYVQPHYRSNPDGNFSNNWSTYGNVNPYTGHMGTRLTPSYSPSYTPSYSPSHYTPSYYTPSYTPHYYPR